MQSLAKHLFRSQYHSTSLLLRGGSSFGLHGALFSNHRFCATTTTMERLVINASNWNDSNYYHRLGFHEEVRDIHRIKEHYRILAKHFHPDNPNAPKDATVAFQNIKEAYEHILANAKEKTEGNTNTEFSAGFRFSDQERRKQQMRFLGDGVPLFMVMTIIFIFIVSRHNKERLQARYLWHLVLIFFTIQLFPRLLAAAILFACHTNYLVKLEEFKEQAATSVVVEKGKNHLLITLEGIAEELKDNIIVQVTTTVPVKQQSQGVPIAVRKETNNDSIGEASVSTTLTFDAGVFTVSVPSPSEGKAEYRIKAVDEKRGFVVADHTLQI
ncbi:heat shock protein [Trypanosoma theileri]|uniref:Heat shock protein n=1 Tax=Trypanosoma theileri TaxID=67003 RepID=A0A1X0P876_9TRYP|nr:heat shock protein [Trypanosoma theileri]ORC93078.1 heat shock protein [Trypanosoma theileri]